MNERLIAWLTEKPGRTFSATTDVNVGAVRLRIEELVVGKGPMRAAVVEQLVDIHAAGVAKINLFDWTLDAMLEELESGVAEARKKGGRR